MQLIDGYDRNKTKRVINVRPLTLAEVKALRPGTRCKFIGTKGECRELTITSVKTWKTRPDDVEVGVKYGMYEYGKFNATEAVSRLVTAEEN